MSLIPRVPQEALLKDPWKTGIGTQHQHYAGIPVNIKGSLQIEPVLKELCRQLNAQVQDCVFCKSVRNAVALQHGMRESDVAQVTPMFETSNLSDEVKAALRVTNYFITDPTGMTDEIWADCLRYYTEDELLDIVLLAMFTSQNKVSVTLGFDPGATAEPLFPTDSAYGTSPELEEAIQSLRAAGVQVTAQEAY
jgi:hypothetical protein